MKIDSWCRPLSNVIDTLKIIWQLTCQNEERELPDLKQLTWDYFWKLCFKIKRSTAQAAKGETEIRNQTLKICNAKNSLDWLSYHLQNKISVFKTTHTYNMLLRSSMITLQVRIVWTPIILITFSSLQMHNFLITMRR